MFTKDAEMETYVFRLANATINVTVSSMQFIVRNVSQKKQK